MLRVTTHDNSGVVTFRLEGRLVGPWVREVEECRANTLAGRAGAGVRFDLRGVTAIDAAGREFLAAAHRQGAELVASGCLLRALVAEIANPSSPDAE